VRDRFSSGLALGLAVALVVSLTSGARLPVALGESASSAGGEYLGLIGNGAVQGQQNVVLFDGRLNKLLVYDVKSGTGEVTLVGVRDTQYDVKFAEWGKQIPKVSEMRDLTKPGANP
jgi:hypothetical protein